MSEANDKSVKKKMKKVYCAEYNFLLAKPSKI